VKWRAFVENFKNEVWHKNVTKNGK